jgi:arsenate reductase
MSGHRKRILFLCTGNAARSQMAEALANALHPDLVDAVSAGSRPAGWVHPMAIRAMAEMGVDMKGARSKGSSEFADEPFDVVVTVCDSAALDCPSWPNAKRIEHWSVEDPSFGDYEDEAHLRRFIATRDDLAERIAGLVPTLV